MHVFNDFDTTFRSFHAVILNLLNYKIEILVLIFLQVHRTCNAFLKRMNFNRLKNTHIIDFFKSFPSVLL